MSDRARLLRQNFSAFNKKVFATLEPGTAYPHNWHMDHLAWQLTRIARGEIRRLIINVPPRSGKSITVSVAFTAWLMGRDPRRRIIAVSYAEDLARKLSLDTRRVMESAWYRELFPALELVQGRQRTMELTTTLQGARFAAGVGGSVLGRGADLIVVDVTCDATDGAHADQVTQSIADLPGVSVRKVSDRTFLLHAHEITDECLLAAATAIADCVKPRELNANYIVPSVFDPAVAKAVAAAVRKATN